MPWFDIKLSSYQYRKSHCEVKTVIRSSYLHNAISYTVRKSSLYWIGALVYIYIYIYICPLAGAHFSSKRCIHNKNYVYVYYHTPIKYHTPSLLYDNDVWGVQTQGAADIAWVLFWYMRCALHVKYTTSNINVVGECEQIPPSVSAHIKTICFWKFVTKFHTKYNRKTNIFRITETASVRGLQQCSLWHKNII